MFIDKKLWQYIHLKYLPSNKKSLIFSKLAYVLQLLWMFSLVSSTDLQEKTIFVFITILPLADLVKYFCLANCYKYHRVHVD